jgi:uncharacterized protein YraI
MTTNLDKVAGLAVAILALTGGSAFAASTTGHISVYASPSDSAQMVGEIAGPQTMSIVHRHGSWCEITSPKAGWVICSDLTTGPRTNLAHTSSLRSAPSVLGYDPHSDPEVADRLNP